MMKSLLLLMLFAKTDQPPLRMCNLINHHPHATVFYSDDGISSTYQITLPHEKTLQTTHVYQGFAQGTTYGYITDNDYQKKSIKQYINNPEPCFEELKKRYEKQPKNIFASDIMKLFIDAFFAGPLVQYMAWNEHNDFF